MRRRLSSGEAARRSRQAGDAIRSSTHVEGGGCGRALARLQRTAGRQGLCLSRAPVVLHAGAALTAQPHLLAPADAERPRRAHLVLQGGGLPLLVLYRGGHREGRLAHLGQHHTRQEEACTGAARCTTPWWWLRERHWERRLSSSTSQQHRAEEPTHFRPPGSACPRAPRGEACLQGMEEGATGGSASSDPQYSGDSPGLCRYVQVAVFFSDRPEEACNQALGKLACDHACTALLNPCFWCEWEQTEQLQAPWHCPGARLRLKQDTFPPALLR